MPKSFEEAWREAVTFRVVSPQIRPLLSDCHAALTAENPHPALVTGSLDRLLTFLCCAAGRTDANCTVTDYFFSRIDSWSTTWQRLPADLRQIVADLGGVLHDTVYAEEIARTFECLPEQLLARLKALENSGE